MSVAALAGFQLLQLRRNFRQLPNSCFLLLPQLRHLPSITARRLHPPPHVLHLHTLQLSYPPLQGNCLLPQFQPSFLGRS